MNRIAFAPSGQYVPPKTAEEVNEARRIRRETATAILAGLVQRHDTNMNLNLEDMAITLADRLLAKLDE